MKRIRDIEKMHDLLKSWYDLSISLETKMKMHLELIKILREQTENLIKEEK